jgi:Tol biopolymer transport system component
MQIVKKLSFWAKFALFGSVLAMLTACNSTGIPFLSPTVTPLTADPTAGIAFVTNRHLDPDLAAELALHQNWELYLVQPDGSGLTRLTHNPRVDTSPTWSPDGRQIAFRSRMDGSSDIFVMGIDGSGLRNLVRDPEDSIFDEFFPEWNPQRDMLAIYTDRFYSPAVGCAWHRLAVIPLEGGKDNIRVLDSYLTEQETLAWAPDGKTIAFSSRCDYATEKAVELYTWDIDTDEVTQLTDDGYANGNPAYAHNGRFLAYNSGRDGNAADIFIMDLETGETVNITNNPRFKDSHPTWSPDDGQIAFVSNRDGNDEIYVMNADGSEPRNITNHPSKDWEPTWSPVP